MKQAFWVGLTALLMAVWLPVLLLPQAEAAEEEAVLFVVEAPGGEEAHNAGQEEAVSMDETVMVRLLCAEGVAELELGEYLTGVVLAEMPVSFHQQALCAQAASARTFTLRRMASPKHENADICSDSTCCQAWIGISQLQQKLSAGWEAAWEKAAEAVEETNGCVLTYGEELIDAVYFSCSGGRTEDAVAVWGGDVPYLQAVDSPGEEEARPYSSEVTVSQAKFRQIIRDFAPDAVLDGNALGWFGGVTYTDGGGVQEMLIGGISITGTELRSLFGLNSTDFEIAVTADSVVFSVHGYGHRVGMSQYGADAMARQGSGWREILRHYYTGVEIEVMEVD